MCDRSKCEECSICAFHASRSRSVSTRHFKSRVLVPVRPFCDVMICISRMVMCVVGCVLCAYVCACACACACAHVCACVRACARACARACVRACVCECACAYACACVYACVYACACACACGVPVPDLYCKKVPKFSLLSAMSSKFLPSSICFL